LPFIETSGPRTPAQSDEGAAARARNEGSGEAASAASAAGDSRHCGKLTGKEPAAPAPAASASGVKIDGYGLSPRNGTARAKRWAWEKVFSAAAPPAAPDPLGDGGNEGLCSLGTRQSESATAI